MDTKLADESSVESALVTSDPSDPVSATDSLSAHTATHDAHTPAESPILHTQLAEEPALDSPVMMSLPSDAFAGPMRSLSAHTSSHDAHTLEENTTGTSLDGICPPTSCSTQIERSCYLAPCALTSSSSQINSAIDTLSQLVTLSVEPESLPAEPANTDSRIDTETETVQFTEELFETECATTASTSDSHAILETSEPAEQSASETIAEPAIMLSACDPDMEQSALIDSVEPSDTAALNEEASPATDYDISVTVQAISVALDNTIQPSASTALNEEPSPATDSVDDCEVHTSSCLPLEPMSVDCDNTTELSEELTLVDGQVQECRNGLAVEIAATSQGTVPVSADDPLAHESIALDITGCELEHAQASYERPASTSAHLELTLADPSLAADNTGSGDTSSSTVSACESGTLPVFVASETIEDLNDSVTSQEPEEKPGNPAPSHIAAADSPPAQIMQDAVQLVLPPSSLPSSQVSEACAETADLPSKANDEPLSLTEDALQHEDAMDVDENDMEDQAQSTPFQFESLCPSSPIRPSSPMRIFSSPPPRFFDLTPPSSSPPLAWRDKENKHIQTVPDALTSSETVLGKRRASDGAQEDSPAKAADHLDLDKRPYKHLVSDVRPRQSASAQTPSVRL